MYTPTELVSPKGQFGGADLVQQRGTLAELAQICQAWGAAVATLHTAAVHASSAPLAARPWVVDPEHLTASMRRAASGFGYAAVLRAYESSRDLRAAASEVDARWTELHWIHGEPERLQCLGGAADHRSESVSSILRTPASEIRRGTWPRPST